MKTYVPVVAGPFATERVATEVEMRLVLGVDRIDEQGRGFLDFGYKARRMGERWYVVHRTGHNVGPKRWRRGIRLTHLPMWRRRQQPTPMTAREAQHRRSRARWAAEDLAAQSISEPDPSIVTMRPFTPEERAALDTLEA